MVDDLDLKSLDSEDGLSSESGSVGDFGYDGLGDFDGGYGGGVGDRFSDLLKELTNFDSYFMELLNGWLGLRWDSDSERFVRSKGVVPIMNVRCAVWCLTFLKNYARKNNIITTLRPNDYRYIMSDVIKTVWINLSTKAEEFGLGNDGDIMRVCNELEHGVSLILIGAGDGSYNQLLSTTIQRNESVNLNPQLLGGVPVSYGSGKGGVGVFGKFKNWLVGDKK